MVERDPARAEEPDVVEQGDVFYLYRPKVERDEAGGLDDVERLHVVLRPRSRQRLVSSRRRRFQLRDALLQGRHAVGPSLQRLRCAADLLDDGLRGNTL